MNSYAKRRYCNETRSRIYEAYDRAKIRDVAKLLRKRLVAQRVGYVMIINYDPRD